MNQYSSFFSALKKLPGLSKEEAVYDFTQGRTRSLRKLSHWEVQELTRRLQSLTPQPPLRPERGSTAPTGGGADKADKMRKAIIAIFRKRGLTVHDAISWAEKQGVYGVKKRFNSYTTQELYVLIGIAEKVQDSFAKSVRRQITNLSPTGGN